MTHQKAKINIANYFKKGTRFIIPAYQRGYKWGLAPKGIPSAAGVLFENLREAFMRRDHEYFVEAVTVVKSAPENFTIVDGQQRTTTLFLLLHSLGETELLAGIDFEYSVRKDSHDFLNGLTGKTLQSVADEDVQDIVSFRKVLEYFAKETASLRHEVASSGTDEMTFAQYLKNCVWLLVNEIPNDKALSTFISMNGLKAVMKPEELVKSQLLVKSAAPVGKPTEVTESFGVLWQIHSDRARLTRNWDSWLYWWNRTDVKVFFSTGNRHPLYHLLVTYWITYTDRSALAFSFSAFKSTFLHTTAVAKDTFERLRKLQKTFEDIYNNPEHYNMLGLLFNTSLERTATLRFFINHYKDATELNRYTKWAAAGCNYTEILLKNLTAYQKRRSDLKEQLADPDVYNTSAKEQVYLQMLRMNISAMHKGKFNFSIFTKRSLEHICAQNPDKNDIDFIRIRDEVNNIYNINSIGNLVLLDSGTNSALSNGNLTVKKQTLFNKIKDGFMLPHTLKVFSKSFHIALKDQKMLFDPQLYWLAEDVAANAKFFMDEFDLYYR